jgi:hypothetical protein
MLKETLKFWASSCHVKGPLPPATTQDTVMKSCMRQVRTGGGGRDMAGPISYLGWQDFFLCIQPSAWWPLSSGEGGGLLDRSTICYFYKRLKTCLQKPRRNLLETLFSRKCTFCGEPAISLHSHTVPLVQWSTRLLPVMRDLGSIPRGVLMWNQDSPVIIVSLYWWPRHDWSLWPRLRRASSRTVTRPLCWQCDNSTWSHIAFLSQFHACCRSSFWLHDQHSPLLGGSPVESLKSHCIHTQFHWSSGPPVCFLSWGTWVQFPGGCLCKIGILLLALSRHNFKTIYNFYNIYNNSFVSNTHNALKWHFTDQYSTSIYQYLTVKNRSLLN